MSIVKPVGNSDKPTVQALPGDIVRDHTNRLMLVHSWVIGGPGDIVRGWRVIAQAAPLSRGEHRLNPPPPGLPAKTAWLVRAVEFITGRPVELVARCDRETVSAVTNCAWRAMQSERTEAP